MYSVTTSFVNFPISPQFAGESLVKAQGNGNSPEGKAHPETVFQASKSPFQHPIYFNPVNPSLEKLSSPNLQWKCTKLFRKLFALAGEVGKKQVTDCVPIKSYNSEGH